MPRRDQPSMCPTVHSQKPVLEFFFFSNRKFFHQAQSTQIPASVLRLTVVGTFSIIRTLPFFSPFGLGNFSALSDSAIFQPFRTLPFLRFFGLRNFSDLSDLEIFPPFSDSAIFQPFRTLPFFRSFGLCHFPALFGLCHFSALSDSAIFTLIRT